MTLFYNFLSKSSIHGLRYLSVGNGPIIKILWALAIIAALSICGSIIYQNVKENRENPIATIIESKSLAKFDFPSVTLVPILSNEGFQPFGLFRKVLDLLSFDCSQANFKKDNSALTKVCMKKANKVKQYFANSLKKAIRNVMKMIEKKTLGQYEKQWREAYYLFCGMNPFLKYQVNVNDTNKVINQIETLLLSNIGLPKSMVFKNMKDSMLLTETIVSMRDVCYANVQDADFEVLKSIALFSLAIEQTEPYQLGTFLALSLGPFGAFVSPNIKPVHETFNTILSKKMGSAIAVRRFDSTSHPKLHPQQQHEVQLKEFILSSDYHLNEYNIFYRALATQLAEEIGLGSEVVKEEDFSVPIVWFCTLDGKYSEKCMDFRLEYVATGLGFTMNYGPWKSKFSVAEPSLNRLRDHKQKETILKANSEIEIYIFHPLVHRHKG